MTVAGPEENCTNGCITRAPGLCLRKPGCSVDSRVSRTRTRTLRAGSRQRGQATARAASPTAHQSVAHDR